MNFSDAERAAVYRAIFERRDCRRFLPDPLPDDLVGRLLVAAHHAPSVGYSQPWNFVLVRSREVRLRVKAAFDEANAVGAGLYEPQRAEKYRSMKLEGILDSPLNLLVTCDRRSGAFAVLGRVVQPEMDLYSTVCAVQNLWLAARAEGVGVGWVSIIEPARLAAIFGLPEGVVPVAYLCVGRVPGFAPIPDLERAGWLERKALPRLVYEERWGERSPAFSPPEPGPPSPPGTVLRFRPIDEAALAELAKLLPRRPSTPPEGG
jgi:5,6-dimethylbenzimidazole synthase